MPSIYGDDSTDFAQSISRDALSSPSAAPTTGSASSKGNKPVEDADVTVKTGMGGDGRAATKGNHGSQS